MPRSAGNQPANPIPAGSPLISTPLLHTIAARSTHTVEIKRSRFLAVAVPAASPDAALALLHAVADPAANHNCWAYRIGADYRSSDDGEPAGTAGRPILAAIDGQALDRVMVVVTRWFGGIKLGGGGLVRAYGGAAAECLRAAERLPIVRYTRLRIACPFADSAAVHDALAHFNGDKLDEQFDAKGAVVEARVPENDVAALKNRLRDATRDRVRIDNQS